MDTEEDIYHASPQSQGRYSHKTVDQKSTYENNTNIITSLSVYSNSLGISGKIDIYHIKEKFLIERKYQLKQIFQGHYFQIWAQYLAMTEMGYEIQRLAFYEISTNTTIDVKIPGVEEISLIRQFIKKFIEYNPEKPLNTNINKCRHCIYCPLCDKTNITDNVYQ